ncbi:hypothetical protein GE061_003480 [Apolygus lucorum]|uniref:Gustatory receptor n=1 Tax=Apolygus lucorum TaxID=248454 RepID=A0A6A4JV55_APOLU|nr:hypothetical protein GE061_003480 [Apolygus lucorum]
MVCLAYEGYSWYSAPGSSPWVPSSSAWYFKIFSYPPVFFVFLSHVTQNFVCKKRIIGLFEAIVEIETSLESLSSVEYVHAGRQRKILVFMMMVKVFNLCGIQDCWTYEWSCLKVVKLLAVVMSRITLVMIKFQFAITLHALRDLVLNMTTLIRRGSKHTGSPVTCLDVERLLRLYNRICSVSQTVNDFYSYQLLGVIVMDYVNINVNAYRIVTYFSSFFNDEEPLSLFWLFVRFMGFAQSTFVLFIIVGACAALQNAAEQFNKALYRQVVSGVNHELQYNEILSAHLTVARSPIFTACGFFYLNYEMIYSVCASNVTFIVLALQMF